MRTGRRHHVSSRGPFGENQAPAGQCEGRRNAVPYGNLFPKEIEKAHSADIPLRVSKIHLATLGPGPTQLNCVTRMGPMLRGDSLAQLINASKQAPSRAVM